MANQLLDAMPDSSAGENDQGNGGIANGISWESATAATMPGSNAASQPDLGSQGAENGTGAGDEKDPPFHEHPRWQEMQKKVKALEAESAEAKTALEEAAADRKMAAYLRSQGFDSIEALEDAAAKADMANAQAEYDKQLVAELNGAIQRQEKTLAQAEQERKSKLADWERNKRAEMREERSAKREIENDITLFSQAEKYPDADFDAIRDRAIVQYRLDPNFNPRPFIEKSARISHEAFQTKLERRLANEEHKRQTTAKAPPSNEKNGSTAEGLGNARVGVPNPAAFLKKVVSRSWEDLLGIK